MFIPFSSEVLNSGVLQSSVNFKTSGLKQASHWRQKKKKGFILFLQIEIYWFLDEMSFGSKLCTLCSLCMYFPSDLNEFESAR